jgi:long-chain acyl-CoA synthetase
MSTNLLITGGTGFIGKATLAGLVDDAAYTRIYVLIRGRDDDTVHRRLKTLIHEVFTPGEQLAATAKLVAVRGDLSEPGLGLTAATRQHLVEHIDQILHVGASTDFGAPLAHARLMNVEGTREVVDLALAGRRAGRLARFDYVSTAFVAGTKPGLVDEATLARGQRFANTYEQSKYEAEALVRAAAGELPTAIYRPSIVVGDSQMGYTPHFKVLYWPIRLLSRKAVRVAFVNQRAKLDVVPVDFVVRAMLALMRRTASVGDTFHLTAGDGGQVSVRRVLRAALRYAGVRKVPVFAPWVKTILRRTPLRRLLDERFWELADLASPYDSYFSGAGVRFDSSRTDALLADLGVVKPRWADYERLILSFCDASRWGRRLPQPTHAYYRQYRNFGGPHATLAHVP